MFVNLLDEMVIQILYLPPFSAPRTETVALCAKQALYN